MNTVLIFMLFLMPIAGIRRNPVRVKVPVRYKRPWEK